MHCVVALGQVAGYCGEAHANDLQAAVLKARDHATNELALYAVWLDQYEGALTLHQWSLPDHLPARRRQARHDLLARSR